MTALGTERRPTRSHAPTLEQARAFCAVADAASYRRAAAELQLTDHVPLIRLVSRLASVLERGKLVTATARGDVTLTTAGREILPAARQFVASAEAMRAGPSTVRFSSYPTIAARLATRCPMLLRGPVPLVMQGVDGARREHGGHQLVWDVQRGRLDLAIAPAGLAEGTELVEHVLYRWRLRAVVADGHPLAGRRRVTPADIAPFKIGASPLGYHSRDLLREAFAIQGTPLEVAIESADHAFLHALARADESCVAVMPDDALDEPDVHGAPCLAVRGRPRLGGRYSLYSRQIEEGPYMSERDAAVAAAALTIRVELASGR